LIVIHRFSDEIHVSSNSIGEDVNEIVESNIPALPRKSFEFSYAEYSLWSFLQSHILVRHLSFLL